MSSNDELGYRPPPPERRAPIPDGTSDQRLLAELEFAYRHDSGYGAALKLLISHDFWLQQPVIRRHLHWLNWDDLAATNGPALNDLSHITLVELDWQGIEADRLAGEHREVGSDHDRVILFWALAMTIGRLRPLIRNTNAYNSGLVAAALLRTNGSDLYGNVPGQLEEPAKRFYQQRRSYEQGRLAE